MLLVVEDNALLSTNLSRALTRHGFTFDLVATGEEALTRVLAGGENYALVLIDVGLPGMSGVELARAIREIGQQDRATVPIVMMTGAGEMEAMTLANLHIAATLYKPFGLAQLLAIIAQCARWVPRGDVALVDDDNLVFDDQQENSNG